MKPAVFPKPAFWVHMSLFFLLSCTPAEPPELSDEQFADLFVAVFELHRRYPFSPDSLIAERESVFKRHGITQDDVERFLETRRAHPEKWESLLIILRARFGDAADVKLRSFQQRMGVPDTTKKTGQQ